MNILRVCFSQLLCLEKLYLQELVKNKKDMGVNTKDRQKINSHDKIESFKKNAFNITSELEYSFFF